MRKAVAWLAALLLLSPLLVVPACAARAAGQPESADKELAAATGLYRRGLYKLAAEEYGQFLQQYPGHPEITSARYGLAICRYRLGEYDAAAKLITTVLADAQFKKRDEAMAVLGHCYLTLKQYPKALAALDELLAKHAGSPHAEAARLNRAQVLYLLGRPADARSACEGFLKQYPQSAQRSTALYFLALSCSALGDQPAAAAALADLLQKYPDSPYSVDASLLLGQTVEAQGQLDTAIQQYRQLLKKAPAAMAARIRLCLGLALYKGNQFEQAAGEFQAILAMPGADESPYAPAARLQLGLCQMSLGRREEARRWLAPIANGDPAHAGLAKFALAECDIADQKFDTARAALLELQRLPKPPVEKSQIDFQVALCLVGLQKYADAATAFQQFRAEYPKSRQASEAVYRQAFCLHKSGDYARSHALCQQAKTALQSGVAEAAGELDAENLFLMRQFADAQKAFAALAGTQHAAKRLRFSVRRGQAAYFAGDIPGAVKLLSPLAGDKRLAQDPGLAEALFVLGDAELQQGKNREAADALGRYLAAVPGSQPEAQCKLMMAQLRGGDAGAAERTLGQLQGAGDSAWTPRACLEMGQWYFQQGRMDKASDLLGKVLALNPPGDLAAPATYLLGWVDFKAGRFKEAAGRFGQVLQKYPKHKLASDAMFQEAVALKETGDAQATAVAADRYLKEYPAGEHCAEAQHTLAWAQIALKHPEQAAATLAGLAADAKSASAGVLYDLAWARRGTNDTAGAIDAYQRLLRDFSASELATPAAVELADLLFQQGKYADAAGLLEKSRDGKAEAKVKAAGLYRLGLCYEKLDDPRKAAAAFAQYATQYPTDPLSASALYEAGLACATQGRFAEAQKHFMGVLQSFPRSEVAPASQLKLGEMQNELGNYDGAAATFQAFLNSHPGDKFAHLAQFGIGWSLESRGQYESARAWYAKVIASNNGPTAARAQFQTGETFLKQQKYPEAIKELLAVEDVYASPQWSPPALYDAGQAFERSGNAAEAGKLYAHICEKYRESKVAELAQQRLKALGKSPAK